MNALEKYITKAKLASALKEKTANPFVKTEEIPALRAKQEAQYRKQFGKPHPGYAAFDRNNPNHPAAKPVPKPPVPKPSPSVSPSSMPKSKRPFSPPPPPPPPKPFGIPKTGSVATPLLLGGGAGYLKGKKSGRADEGAIRGAAGGAGGSILGSLLGIRMVQPVMEGSAKADVRRYKKKLRKAKDKYRADVKSYKSKSFRERLRTSGPKKERTPFLNPQKMVTKAQRKALIAAILATSLGGTAGYQALTVGVDKKDKK